MEQKIEDLYEDEYKDEYYEDAKDEYAEYEIHKVYVARRYGESEYNQSFLKNKEELEEIAFDTFKEDYKNGKIKKENGI